MGIGGGAGRRRDAAPRTTAGSLRRVDFAESPAAPLRTHRSAGPCRVPPMRLLITGAAVIALAACGATPDPLPPTDLTDWRPETITLPPEFAPGLPAGREVLLFAPGMFTEGAPDFWSYTFLMEIEEDGVDAARVEELFELYFDGLITAVGGGGEFDLPADPAQVSFEATGSGRFQGQVDTYDAFVTGEPLELHMLVDAESAGPGRTLLTVRACPTPPDGGALWRSLGDAAASLRF